MLEQAPSPPASNSGSLKLRITLALLASAARLVPIPFLDDILRARVLQLAVKRTLVAHGRAYSSSRLAPIWSAGEGCAEGCVLFVLKVPFVLLTYPIRKIWRWITAVHGLARDLTEVILLGRALDRVLSRGMLMDGPGLEDEAARVRLAFDNALTGMDVGVLRAALGDSLGKVSGLAGAAARAVRSLFRKRTPPDEAAASLPESVSPEVDAGARAVESVMARPDVIALLERFDAKLDENLKVLAAR